MGPLGRPCQLTVCRGCCCGTKKKVPGVDHKGQLARLSAIEDHAGQPVPVRTSTCLGICFKANVVVVRPSAQGRAAGARPVWLGEVNDDGLVEALDDWIFAGGPGLAPLPAVLEPHLTSKDAKKPKKSKKSKKIDKKGERGKKIKRDKKQKKRQKAEKDKKDRGKKKGRATESARGKKGKD